MIKFKNTKEKVAFILMNIFGSPFGWLLLGVWLGWYGFFGSLISFYICYRLFKKFGKHTDCKLEINPSLGIFNNKKTKKINYGKYYNV